MSEFIEEVISRYHRVTAYAGHPGHPAVIRPSVRNGDLLFVRGGE
jgi:hypothetical protein